MSREGVGDILLVVKQPVGDRALDRVDRVSGLVPLGRPICSWVRPFRDDFVVGVGERTQREDQVLGEGLVVMTEMSTPLLSTLPMLPTA